MPNPYFKFKQFTVWHDKCAMKVGTDGVLLGAWADPGNTKDILDIGTGTGLIALMLAQRSEANIDAVEINEEAFEQATENVKASSWGGRINVIHKDFQAYSKSTGKKYNFLVSNPPYFKNSLKSFDEDRNAARHSHLLTIEELFLGVKNLISNNGRFSMVFPFDEFEGVIEIARYHQLHNSRITIVHPNLSLPPRRVLLEFSKVKTNVIHDSITIEKQKRHDYTDEYIELTKDFYLAF